MFDKDISFSGRHADRLRQLAPSKLAGGQAKQRMAVFDNYAAVLAPAAIAGFLWGRYCEADHERKTSDAKVLFEKVNRVKDELEFAYRLIMLLHDKEKMSREERLNRAFRYDGDVEKTKSGESVFFGYVRGGIDIFFEKILEDSTSTDEDIQNIYEFVQDAQNTLVKEISVDDIIRLCNEAGL